MSKNNNPGPPTPRDTAKLASRVGGSASVFVFVFVFVRFAALLCVYLVVLVGEEGLVFACEKLYLVSMSGGFVSIGFVDRRGLLLLECICCIVARSKVH